MSFFRLLLALLFMLLLSTQAFAQMAITVIGRASLDSPDPDRQALHSAFRSAIEQAVGVQLASETMVKNNEVLRDQIYAYAEGFVEKWDILERQQRQREIILTLKVFVREGRLNKTLFLNGLDVRKIYDWMGEPRVLIVAQEEIDNQASNLDLTQTRLESAFIDKGIRVFYEEQLRRINERDKILAVDDPQAAIALGQRFGAEIVVAAKGIARFSRELKISGYNLNFYSAVLSIRAFRTTTGEVLLSERYTPSKEQDTSAIGRVDAAMKALEGTLDAAVPDMLFQIVRNWYDSFSQLQTLYLVAKKVDYDDLQRLKQDLFTIAGVQRVLQRGFYGGVAELEVRHEETAPAVVGAFLKKNSHYRVIGEEQNKTILERIKP